MLTELQIAQGENAENSNGESAGLQAKQQTESAAAQPSTQPAAQSGEIETLLTPDDMLERLRDPNYLPTMADIEFAFVRESDLYNKSGKYDPLTGYVSVSRIRWINFCHDKKRPTYEFLTREFINALGDYLIERVEEIRQTPGQQIVIMEVAAGNGRMTHFLGKRLMERNAHNIVIIPTDSGEWELKPDFYVNRLDYREALDRFMPQIVICSWMPQFTDFTTSFRECPSVQEYILIGHSDSDVCGNAWQTWGHLYDENQEQPEIPYERDGFHREDLDSISNLQIGMSDSPGRYGYSRTVSFRRM